MQKLETEIIDIFKLLNDEITILSAKSDCIFDYSERMIIERILFKLLSQICEKFLNYELKGFTEFYKSEVLKNEICINNKILTSVIQQIFNLKFYLQKLSSDNAYVRGDAFSNIGINKDKIYTFIKGQICLINNKMSFIME